MRKHAVFLGLDYDGTLTPIAQYPSMAKLSSKHRKILRDLNLLRDLKICILSGRPVKEIKGLVNIPKMIYAGNHGFELEGPYLHWVHPGAVKAKKLLKRLAVRLENGLRSVQGVYVENKTYTLSIHYRQVPRDKIQKAKSTFLRLVARHVQSGHVLITEGKKVWEIRPAIPWNKGHIVRWLLDHKKDTASRRALPIYIGDDRTDEDAFKALGRKGVTVKVTAQKDQASAARFWLRSPQEVFIFLNKIKAAWKTAV